MTILEKLFYPSEYNRDPAAFVRFCLYFSCIHDLLLLFYFVGQMCSPSESLLLFLLCM